MTCNGLSLEEARDDVFRGDRVQDCIKIMFTNCAHGEHHQFRSLPQSRH